MRKLTRSWQIFRKSLTLIGREQKLLIFPLLSACAMLLLFVLIIAGIAGVCYLAVNGSPDGAEAAFADTGSEEGNPALNAVVFAIFALVYLFCMTVANFCNTAFFSEIIRGLGGENVSVSRGFGYALYRLKAIFFWSLLASTIGIILSVLERRAGLVGRIVLKLIGVVWAVASVFAVPAIVCDPELSNPFTALKRSASIIRRTWGETLIGFAGLHIITGVGVFLFLLALFAVGALIGAAGGGAVPVITGAGVGMLLFLCFFAFCYLVSVAEKVYIASLYLYATDRDELNLFDDEELAAAFRSRE